MYKVLIRINHKDRLIYTVYGDIKEVDVSPSVVTTIGRRNTHHT